MTEKTSYDRQQLINSLLHISHDQPELYAKIGILAGKSEPELFAHFISWNSAHGKIRDSKVAFPVLALRTLTPNDRDLVENAVANLLLLDPRKLVRAYEFNTELSAGGTFKRKPGGGREIVKAFELGPLVLPNHARKVFETGLRRYLSELERKRGRWTRTAVKHRGALLRLYKIAHYKPSALAQRVLFDRDYPPGSVFQKIATLSQMTPADAAAVILKHDLKIEVAMGAYKQPKTEEFWLALIHGMTGNQLVTNAAMLKKHDVFKNATLKAAYDHALDQAKKSKQSFETLKASRAVEVLEDDPELAEKLLKLQRTKSAQLAGIDGDWLVLADASGSMRASLDLGRRIAALIAEQVRGKVWLIFFDENPTPFEVAGLSYDQIVEKTKRVQAGGSTSIGCGLDYLRNRGVVVNGIAIASDGGDNHAPLFPSAYKKYVAQMGIEPTVYLFHVSGDNDALTPTCRYDGINLERFEMGSHVDYYSLPALVATMKINRYQMLDDIMATPLLTFNDLYAEAA